RENKGVKLLIEEPTTSSDEKKTFERVLVARMEKMGLTPTIGIGFPFVPKLNKDKPLSKSLEKKLSDDDVQLFANASSCSITQINSEKVTDFVDVVKHQYNNFDKPLKYTFSKTSESVDSKNNENAATKTETQSEFTVTIPPCAMKELGVRFAIGEISAVRVGSEAEKLGIKPGDKLIEVDGKRDFDPMKLSQKLQKQAAEGLEKVEIVILKPVTKTEAKDSDVAENDTVTAKNPAETEEKDVEIAKEDKKTKASKEYIEVKYEIPLVIEPERLISGVGASVACSPIGISYNITNQIAGVDSKAGDYSELIGKKVVAFEFPDYVPPGGVPNVSYIKPIRKWYFWKTGFSLISICEAVEIPFVYYQVLKTAPDGTAVKLHCVSDQEDAKIVTKEFKAQTSTDWFDDDRGMNFELERFTMRTGSVIVAAKLGFFKTVDGTLAVYRFLRNIGGRVSARAMGGPVAIVQIAYNIASESVGRFLLLLCLLGANLAVLNILPIPVLDGGHLVFLAYEGIFRKPPNESVQVGLSYLGLLLLLGLMFWAISLDLGFISRF
ncbi:MAG: site-2 protease family protein, partial [Thermoguttaceae bacterium]